MSAMTAILVATLLGQAYYTPEEAQALFAQANEAYTREDYTAAREGYEKLLSHGHGRPGRALQPGHHVSGAGRPGPRGARAGAGLEGGRPRAGPGGEPLAGPRAAEGQGGGRGGGGGLRDALVRGHAGRRSSAGRSWARGSSASGCCCCSGSSRPGRRSWAAVLAALALLVALPSGGLLAAHAWVDRTVHEAVVLSPTLVAREFPKGDAKVALRGPRRPQGPRAGGDGPLRAHPPAQRPGGLGGARGRRGDMIEVHEATKVYRRGRTEVRALAGVSLTVPRGQFLSVMGPSGSGKSTLLNLLGALDVPTGGSIRIDGQELARMDDDGALGVPAGAAGLRVPVLQPDAHADGGGERDAAGAAGGPAARGAAARGPRRCWRRWACAAVRSTGRTSCPAGRCSAWRWRERC